MQDKEVKETESWLIQLRKWSTPILTAILLFVVKEYYTKMDAKLTMMVNHIYRSDSIHLRMNLQMDFLRSEQSEHSRRIDDLEHEVFFIKPEDIRHKKRK
jgi:hypothetical protein